MTYKTFRLHERPDLRAQIDRLSVAAWPEFLLHGNAQHWEHLFSTFAEYQVLICDGDDKVVALGHTVPLFWDSKLESLPATIDAILTDALQAREFAANTLSALAAIVAQDYRGQGLSSIVLHEMRRLALLYGLQALIVPVRPTLKHLYPLIPFERYVRWVREDGAPFDPWLRVHWRLGATQLKIIPRSLTVTGSVSQWEEWTGIQMPDSGEYVVPGALQPVKVDRNSDLGLYEDPNVWMKHSVSSEK